MSEVYAKLFWLMHFFCHQRPERSFHYGDIQWLVCARCSGTVIGALLMGTLFLRMTARQHPSLRKGFLYALLTLPLIGDGFGGFSYTFSLPTGNSLRFLTGICFSIGAIMLFIFSLAYVDLAIQRFSKSWLSALVILSLVTFFISCAAPVPGRKEIVKPPDPPISHVSIETTNDLIVYLDTSSPMKGYVQTDGQSIFSRTLRTLREFSTTLSPPVRVQMRTVATTVGPFLSQVALAEASTNQSYYTGTESNLVAAFASFPQGLSTAATAPSVTPAVAEAIHAATQVPAAPPARFHVLVTDGVQYANRTTVDQSCAAGADQFCVQEKIFQLLGQGWGGVVIGLRSQFCCAFFSEKSQRPVPFDTRGRTPKDFRPFYLYIFSPDQAALHQFVTRFKESLRRATDADTLLLRELSLTAPYAEGEMARAFKNEAVQAGDKVRLRAGRVDESDPLLLSLRLQVENNASEVPFTVALKVPWTQHALDSGSAEELAKLLHWKLEAVFPKTPQPGKRYADLRLAPAAVQPQGDGSLLIHATAQWPNAAGEPDWRAYRLTAFLNTEAEAPPWVREWSVEDDRTSPSGNRTLDLLISLLGVWRNDTIKNRAVVETYLRIGPQ
ncbi:MAG: DUF2085 domain-containing protein [Acidobacteria bacterium]|nr:DUF2085 domain-containing protein [Acidobacteriota bacterium]